MTVSAATAAAAVMVQHLGFGDCQGCFTRAQQMCPDPWQHMACAVCGKCDSMWELRAEHRQECPAVAIARLSAACKAAAAQRNPQQVQERVQTALALKQQFDDVDSSPDPEEFSPYDWEDDM